MANKFEEKRIFAEVLGELYQVIADKEKYIHQDYRCVGKEAEQATDWRTNELLWEDEEKTVPKYRDKYEYVPKTDDELTEDDKLKIKVYQSVMIALEKML